MSLLPSTFDVTVFLVIGAILIFTLKCCCHRDARQHILRRGGGAAEDIGNGIHSHPTQGQPRQQPAPPAEPKRKQAEIPVLAVGTVVVYKNGETKLNCNVNDNEGCIICLEEFEDGDYCRVLSECQHIYHMLCIDRWLVKDTHCPLCRCSVQFWNQK